MTDDQDKPERGKSAHWLHLIEHGERAFREWQDCADNIDKTYASLEQLRSHTRDSEFQLFWSNIQVMGPSVYARPPVPVVTPKFKDRRPLYRTASEMLERCCNISFDLADIDQHMIAMRDDLTIVGRGVAWVRYESDDGDKVCYESVDRKDFIHEPARKWCDVDWVARRSWLTRDEMKERFKEAAEDVSYEERKDDKGGVSSISKCGVWELWCKSENRVVWVTEGCDETLDEGEPHLKLAGFFPCPRPAYATLQRRSLVPVPDMLFYKDQLDEVTALTRRIHALADAIKVRGFYSGSGDIGEAVERAIRLTDDTQVLIPVPAMAALMQSGGDPIVWLPLDMIATTVTGLIELRRQVIDDVYQIIGLSDIMRGSTVASETLGAQQLKQQNGSYRVRDKQNELVRVARDLVRIGAEIMANEFSSKTLEEMAQMDLPTADEQAKKLKEYQTEAKAEMDGLKQEAMAMAQQAQQEAQGMDPAQMQEAAAQAEQQFLQQQEAIVQKWSAKIQECQEEITIDQVMEFLKDEKLRPFALDIETDSTIYPDEMAEKQSRREFMGAFSEAMATMQPMFMMGPEAISVAGGVFKFALSPYRVGRELEALIDDFVDQGPAMAQKLQEMQGDDNGAEEQAKAETMKVQAEMAKTQADTVLKQAEAERKMMETQGKAQKDQGDLQLSALKLQQSDNDSKVKAAEAMARIDQMKAMTMKLLAEAGVVVSSQQLDEFNSLADIEIRKADQAIGVAQGAAKAADGATAKPAPKAPANAAAIMDGLGMLAQMVQQQGQALSAVVAHIGAPKEIVRGPDGKAVGVRTVVN